MYASPRARQTTIVILAFLVKPLGLDLDTDLGKPSQKTITPDAAGTFPAICDHYCGSGHGNMKMTVIVE